MFPPCLFLVFPFPNLFLIFCSSPRCEFISFYCSLLPNAFCILSFSIFCYAFFCCYVLLSLFLSSFVTALILYISLTQFFFSFLFLNFGTKFLNVGSCNNPHSEKFSYSLFFLLSLFLFNRSLLFLFATRYHFRKSPLFLFLSLVPKLSFCPKLIFPLFFSSELILSKVFLLSLFSFTSLFLSSTYILRSLLNVFEFLTS